MVPKAYIKVKMPNRVRLYVPEKRKARGYFSRLKAGIRTLEGVRQVEVNPVTGSVVIQFDGVLSKIVEKAQLAQLFELGEGPARGGPWIQDFFHEVEKLDQKIRRSTDGAFDLPNTAALIFIGLGTLQIFRREILPVASTLFLYAANLLAISKNGNTKLERPKLKTEVSIA